jgi:hypothetical protein
MLVVVQSLFEDAATQVIHLTEHHLPYRFAEFGIANTGLTRHLRKPDVLKTLVINKDSTQ